MKASTSATATATTKCPIPWWVGWRFWLLAGLVLLVDHLTKLWTVLAFEPHVLHPHPDAVTVIPGFLYFGRVHNTGAAWGMLEGQSVLLVVVAVAALLGILFLRRSLGLGLHAHQWLFGAFAGGILGNLFDRLFRGYVVDFIDVDLGFYRWPTFNLADTALTVSVGVLLLLSFTGKSGPSGAAKP